MKETMGRIVSNRRIARDTYDMSIAVEEGLSPLPGQFVQIGVPKGFLRRPISIAGYADGLLRLIIRAVGEGTSSLTALAAGEQIPVLFPLGKPFPPQEGEAWLVGGGIGTAPLLYLAQQLAREGRALRSFVGFRSAEDVYGHDELQRCGAVELSVGGLVTEGLLAALAEGSPAVVYSCGPRAMLAAVKKICCERGIKLFGSLEERMGCGVGACLVCACRSGDTFKRVCVDGPVFDLSEVELS